MRGDPSSTRSSTDTSDNRPIKPSKDDVGDRSAPGARRSPRRSRSRMPDEQKIDCGRDYLPAAVEELRYKIKAEAPTGYTLTYANAKLVRNRTADSFWRSLIDDMLDNEKTRLRGPLQDRQFQLFFLFFNFEWTST